MKDTTTNQTINGKRIFQMAHSTLTYYDLKANYICRYHTTDKLQLVVLLSGVMEYTFDLEETSQSGMTIITLPPYTQCHLHVVSHARIMVLELHEMLLKTIVQNIREFMLPVNPAGRHKPCREIPMDNALYSSIQRIHGEYVGNKENPYLVELEVSRLLYTLMKTEYACFLMPPSAMHPMEQVQDYIRRNITKTIRINTLAAMAGMNSSNFSNTFKRHFGQTPQDYIQSHKMAYAQKLLRNRMVTDVAFEVGYENVSTFITHFKKVYHMTPKQYQLCEQSS